MVATSERRAEQIREANIRYHDAAAASYDAKWGIDFGATGRDQVHAKLAKALGRWPDRPFGDALEIGAGTGYFCLNLLQLGLIERVTATDISEGMLEALRASAASLDVKVRATRAAAEELPADDESFDLVFGHAVLHHLADPGQAFAEIHRVLRPGGTVAFCGEPSRYGDVLAAAPKRGANLLAPLWRFLIGARERPPRSRDGRYGDDLESKVDIHSFAPGALRELLHDTGFAGIRIRGEELLSSLYGWTLRSLEATADPERVPWSWQSFAFRSYLAVQSVDAALLEPRLPPSLFYNLVFSAHRPE